MSDALTLVLAQVRITSDDYFPIGTVLVFDATHLPYGCSVCAI